MYTVDGEFTPYKGRVSEATDQDGVGTMCSQVFYKHANHFFLGFCLLLFSFVLASTDF